MQSMALTLLVRNCPSLWLRILGPAEISRVQKLGQKITTFSSCSCVVLIVSVCHGAQTHLCHAVSLRGGGGGGERERETVN